ncbi:hypothetical protein Tco_0780667, partial [Tanacetum coccineum]
EYEDDHDALGGDHIHHGDNDVEEGNLTDSTELHSDEGSLH